TLCGLSTAATAELVPWDADAKSAMAMGRAANSREDRGAFLATRHLPLQHIAIALIIALTRPAGVLSSREREVLDEDVGGRGRMSVKGKIVRFIGGAFLNQAQIVSAESVGGFRRLVLRSNVPRPRAGTKMQFLLPGDEM